MAFENSLETVGGSNKEKIADRTVIATVVAGLILYYCGFAHLELWLAVLVLYICTWNKVEIGVFLLLFGSSLFGRMFASQLFYLSTIVISLSLGIAFLYVEIIKVINRNLYPYLFFFILLSLAFVAYLLGPSTAYANEKILKLTVRSLIWVTVFLIFNKSEGISSTKISLAFLVLAMLYIAQSFQIYGIKPHSVFDFSFFRNFCDIIGRNENNTLVVNYQTLGYLALASSTFCLIKANFKDDVRTSVAILSLSFWIIAMSGTRQTLFAFAVLVTLRILLHSNDKLFSLRNILVATVVFIAFIAIVTSLGSEYYNTMLSSDASIGTRLHRDTTTPLKVMSVNPLFGVGFGGYPLYANKNYPHNFFIEILSEFGIIGLFVLALIIFVFIYTSPVKSYIRYKSANYSFIFPLVVLFFMRGQISGDLSDSISFLCVLFSCVPQETESVRIYIE